MECFSPENQKNKHLNSDEWYLRYLSFSGLNWRFDAGFSEEKLLLLVEKLDEPGL